MLSYKAVAEQQYMGQQTSQSHYAFFEDFLYHYFTKTFKE